MVSDSDTGELMRMCMYVQWPSEWIRWSARGTRYRVLAVCAGCVGSRGNRISPSWPYLAAPSTTAPSETATFRRASSPRGSTPPTPLSPSTPPALSPAQWANADRSQRPSLPMTTPISPPLVCVVHLYYAIHVRGYAVLPGVDIHVMRVRPCSQRMY